MMMHLLLSHCPRGHVYITCSKTITATLPDGQFSYTVEYHSYAGPHIGFMPVTFFENVVVAYNPALAVVSLRGDPCSPYDQCLCRFPLLLCYTHTMLFRVCTHCPRIYLHRPC